MPAFVVYCEEEAVTGGVAERWWRVELGSLESVLREVAAIAYGREEDGEVVERSGRDDPVSLLVQLLDMKTE